MSVWDRLQKQLLLSKIISSWISVPQSIHPKAPPIPSDAFLWLPRLSPSIVLKVSDARDGGTMPQHSCRLPACPPVIILKTRGLSNTAWIALKFPLSDSLPSWTIYWKEWLQKCLAAPIKTLSKLKVKSLGYGELSYKWLKFGKKPVKMYITGGKGFFWWSTG